MSFFINYINFMVMALSTEIYAWDDRPKEEAGEYLGIFHTDTLRFGQIMLEKMTQARKL